MDAILADYTSNLATYTELQRRVDSAVAGRCCHHKVVVLSILRNLYDVKTYLEIGVHNGTSMAYILAQPGPPVLCVGVDLFSDTTSRYAKDSLQQGRTEASLQALNQSKSTVRLLQANSQDPATVPRVLKALNGRPVDLLFLDADHEYAGVRTDFLLYSPLLRSGGLLVLDDACSMYPGILRTIQDTILPSGEFEMIGLFQDNDLILRKR